MTVLKIATRKSPLAIWQTEYVAAQLKAAHPGVEIELVPLSTRGDEVLDRSLAAIGGKGLFLKELELAMERGEANLAVHSLKDVPMELEPGFTLAAVLPREDESDALVSNVAADLESLPTGAIVGTSSLRRQAQLRALRPDLEIRDLRGNVNTRLAKLDAGEYDAIILAAAGLKRLGFDARIRTRLQAPHWLPAPAQGAIAIECFAADAESLRLCRALNDAATWTRVSAERAMNRALHGSCHVPVSALATLQGDRLHLQGAVGDVTTGRLVRAEAEMLLTDDHSPEDLGRFVANQLLEGGAAELLGAALLD